jgi:hypothetical protein
MDLAPAFAGLSDKQRLYVQARLEGDTPGVAARRAGVEVPNTSWRLMENNPVVAEALRKGREISIRSTGITREKVSEMLLEAYHNSTNAMEQVAAARELGKLHGLYEANKVQVEHKLAQLKHENELRALPLEELERLAALEGEFIDITPTREKALVRAAS